MAERQYFQKRAGHYFENWDELYAGSPVTGVAGQPGELRVGEMNERRVVAALEIDVGLAVDAVVDDDVEPIALADRRDSAARAVAKQALDLALGGEVDVLAELLAQVGETDVVRGGNDGQHVSAVPPQDDALGQALAGDLADLGSPHRRQGRLVRDHLVGDVLIKITLKRGSDGQGTLQAVQAPRTGEGRPAERRLTERGCRGMTSRIPPIVAGDNRRQWIVRCSVSRERVPHAPRLERHAALAEFAEAEAGRAGGHGALDRHAAPTTFAETEPGGHTGGPPRGHRPGRNVAAVAETEPGAAAVPRTGARSLMPKSRCPGASGIAPASKASNARGRRWPPPKRVSCAWHSAPCCSRPVPVGSLSPAISRGATARLGRCGRAWQAQAQVAPLGGCSFPPIAARDGDRSCRRVPEGTVSTSERQT